jgi:hypothetical protein
MPRLDGGSGACGDFAQARERKTSRRARLILTDCCFLIV